MDALWGYSGFQKLAADDIGEVEVSPSLPSEVRVHLWSNLVAAFSDAGSDGGVEVGGIGAEAPAHGVHGMLGHAGGGAAPSGMHGSYGVAALIGQQDGNTVGGLDGDDRSSGILEQRVTLAQDATAAQGFDAIGGMNLAHGGELGKPARDIGGARAETVQQPLE